MLRRALPALSAAPVLAAIATLTPAARADEPTTDQCLAANEKSITLRSQHAWRAARLEALTCTASSCPAEVAKECVRRIDELTAAMPTVVFEAKDAAGNDVTDVRVSMDGEVVTEHLDGTALVLDPGVHTFQLEGARQPPVTKQLMLSEGMKDRHEVVELSAPAPPPPPTVPAPPRPPAPAPSRGLGTQRVLALVAGGLGVVGVGVGAGFGIASMGKHSDAQGLCPAATCPTSAGVTAWNDARTAGDVSTVGFVAGAVLLTGGAALWLAAPSSSGSGVQAGAGVGSLWLRGTW